MSRAAIAIALLAALALAACGGGEEEPSTAATGAAEVEQAPASDAKPGGEAVLSGSLPLLNGEPQDLADYRGKVVLIVNTASECGFAPQFEGLEQLYRDKRGKGLVLLGFPADDVAGQEPRSDEEIAEFCEANFGVSFPMFEKSDVLGAGANPVFQKLNAEAGEPTWNFNKYLLDRDGDVVEHYEVSTEPDDPALVDRVDELLERS